MSWWIYGVYITLYMNTCSVSCSVLLEWERNCKSTFILLGTTNKTTSKVSVKKETVRVANLIHFMHFKLFFFLYYYHTKSVVSCRWLCGCVTVWDVREQFSFFLNTVFVSAIIIFDIALVFAHTYKVHILMLCQNNQAKTDLRSASPFKVTSPYFIHV